MGRQTSPRAIVLGDQVLALLRDSAEPLNGMRIVRVLSDAYQAAPSQPRIGYRTPYYGDVMQALYRLEKQGLVTRHHLADLPNVFWEAMPPAQEIPASVQQFLDSLIDPTDNAAGPVCP